MQNTPESAADRPPGRTRPLLTAIASGKGGVGKTWFAVTLAHALARANDHPLARANDPPLARANDHPLARASHPALARANDHPVARVDNHPLARAHRGVLLFDGDLGLANVDIQLGLNATHDLGAVLAGRVAMADAAQACTAGGFDVLAGRSGSGALAGLGNDAVDTLLAGLARLPYDHVLLDLSAGVDPATRRLAAGADILLVIATDEPTSLTDAYAVIKLHAAAVPAGDVRLVINQAASEATGRRTYATLARACTQFLGRSPVLAGVVRRDDRVRDAIRRQMPLLSRHPASVAGADVTRIAGELL
jgi:flagellar biosynthesis protein FlhG